jgi:two-component system, NarL family, nitrate/nitrite response regulator NarL
MLVLCSPVESVRLRWREGLSARGELREAESVADLQDCLRSRQPALVLLHVSLPGLSGPQDVRLLKQRYPEVKFAALADVPSDEQGLAWLRGGSDGYLNAYIAPALLAQAVEVMQMGEVWVGRSLMQRLIGGLAATRPRETSDLERRLDGLTEREREIALLIAQGASNKRIAARLAIAERTVKAHLTAVFRKTGARDRLSLALLVNRQAEAVPVEG